MLYPRGHGGALLGCRPGLRGGGANAGSGTHDVSHLDRLRRGRAMKANVRGALLNHIPCQVAVGRDVQHERLVEPGAVLCRGAHHLGQILTGAEHVVQMPQHSGGLVVGEAVYEWANARVGRDDHHPARAGRGAGEPGLRGERP